MKYPKRDKELRLIDKRRNKDIRNEQLAKSEDHKQMTSGSEDDRENVE